MASKVEALCHATLQLINSLNIVRLDKDWLLSTCLHLSKQHFESDLGRIRFLLIGKGLHIDLLVRHGDDGLYELAGHRHLCEYLGRDHLALWHHKLHDLGLHELLLSLRELHHVEHSVLLACGMAVLEVHEVLDVAREGLRLLGVLREHLRLLLERLLVHLGS